MIETNTPGEAAAAIMQDNSGCPACLVAEAQRSFEAREMMFGTRERFTYIECGGCGSIRIHDVPKDLDRHYPSDYYAFSTVNRLGLGNRSITHRLKRGLRRAHMRHAIKGKSMLGYVANAIRRGQTPFISGSVEDVRSWTRPAGGPESTILDVGCGSGLLLWELHEAGFTNLTGIEPYADADQVPETGPAIYRRSIEEAAQQWPGRFDLVMLHHVFEHLPNPDESLRWLRALLQPGGTLLIRVPVAGTFAWRTFGTDWVQLDPPRHLFVPSEDGLRKLGTRAGLKLDRVEYDSTGFQVWASEQYQQDIPLLDARSWSVAPRTLAAGKHMAACDAQAARLNAAGDGDQAAFYFTLLRTD